MNATQSHVTIEFLESQGFSKIWTGARIKNRNDGTWYGVMNTGFQSFTEYTHRVSWILHFGPIPQGMWVLHDCPEGDNPACVCPAHLWLGTPSENSQDAANKGCWEYRKCDKHPRAKLTWDDVDNIRNMWRLGQNPTIARQFGVSTNTIHAIVTERTWKPCFHP